jgi:ribosomal protein L40E
MSDGNLVSRCGIYCGSCPMYRASHDNDEKAKFDIAFSTRCTLDQVRCEGCGSADRFELSQGCTYRKCADDRGIVSCGECKEFPCASLQQLYDQDVEKWKGAPENAKRIKEVGVEKWLEEIEDKNRCKHCDSKLPLGAKSCRVCGALVIRETK